MPLIIQLHPSISVGQRPRAWKGTTALLATHQGLRAHALIDDRTRDCAGYVIVGVPQQASPLGQIFGTRYDTSHTHFEMNVSFYDSVRYATTVLGECLCVLVMGFSVGRPIGRWCHVERLEDPMGAKG
jgi:hypothetical protein